jgi:hypothetical protein
MSKIVRALIAFTVTPIMCLWFTLVALIYFYSLHINLVTGAVGLVFTGAIVSITTYFLPGLRTLLLVGGVVCPLAQITTLWFIEPPDNGVVIIDTVVYREPDFHVWFPILSERTVMYTKVSFPFSSYTEFGGVKTNQHTTIQCDILNDDVTLESWATVLNKHQYGKLKWHFTETAGQDTMVGRTHLDADKGQFGGLAQLTVQELMRANNLSAHCVQHAS